MTYTQQTQKLLHHPWIFFPLKPPENKKIREAESVLAKIMPKLNTNLSTRFNRSTPLVIAVIKFYPA